MLEIRKRHDGQYNVWRYLWNTFSSTQWEVIHVADTFQNAMIFADAERSKYNAL